MEARISSRLFLSFFEHIFLLVTLEALSTRTFNNHPPCHPTCVFVVFSRPTISSLPLYFFHCPFKGRDIEICNMPASILCLQTNSKSNQDRPINQPSLSSSSSRFERAKNLARTPRSRVNDFNLSLRHFRKVAAFHREGGGREKVKTRRNGRRVFWGALSSPGMMVARHQSDPLLFQARPATRSAFYPRPPLTAATRLTRARFYSYTLRPDSDENSSKSTVSIVCSIFNLNPISNIY